MTTTKTEWVVQWFNRYSEWWDKITNINSEASGKNVLEHQQAARPNTKFRLIERTTTTTTTERVIK